MELNIGIICASLPTLRALFAKFFPNTFSSSIVSAADHACRNSDRSGEDRLVSPPNMAQIADGGILVQKEIQVGDVETGTGTFLASDSEVESQRAQPGISIRAEITEPEVVAWR